MEEKPHDHLKKPPGLRVFHMKPHYHLMKPFVRGVRVQLKKPHYHLMDPFVKGYECYPRRLYTI